MTGSTGALLRIKPITYQCGEPAHECTNSDVIPPNSYGVIQSDPPVLDAAGWYWLRVDFDTPTANGQDIGWVSATPPYLNMLNPPQMISGVPFSIVASYGPGPILTNAVCINDGVTSAATMQLQSATCCSDNGPGQVGSLICPWPVSQAGVGNHKVVIQAVNKQGTAASNEFQFSVTSAPQSLPPTQPTGLRIAGAGGGTVTVTGVK
jgi:hypothetical protein